MKTLTRSFVISMLCVSFGAAQTLMDSLSLYHPLHNGNIWIYKKESNIPPDISLFSVTVVNDTIVNLRRFSLIETKNLQTGSVTLTNARFDSATGNYYEGSDFHEFLVDSTTASDSMVHFTVTVTPHVTCFGLTSTRRSIDNGNIDLIQYTNYLWGLGKTTYYRYHVLGAYEDTELLYAKINGKEYGTNPLSAHGNDMQSFPTQFSLSQNYPNPFNPSTTIRYDLPVSGNVTLKIFDMLGREMSMIVNEQQPAGRYSVQFSASPFASGLYFYQLRAGNFSATKRMSLVK